MTQPPSGTATRDVSSAIELAEGVTYWSHHRCSEEAISRLGLVSSTIGREADPLSHQRPKLILTRKSKNLLFNRLIGIGLRTPATQAQVDQAIQLARENRVERFAVDLSPFAQPRALRSWLQERGFKEGGPGGKLWRDGCALARSTSPANQPRISVRRVKSNDASLWVDLISQVWRTFGSRRFWYEARVAAPDWYHYLGYAPEDRTKPIAAGALHVADVEVRKGETIRVGHLVDGVTLGSYRRLGSQSAMIRRRVSDGLALGCSLFTSETAPPLPRMPLVSYRNLCRQGFELAYLRSSWVFDHDNNRSNRRESRQQ